jgi:hypothetical protein
LALVIPISDADSRKVEISSFEYSICAIKLLCDVKVYKRAYYIEHYPCFLVVSYCFPSYNNPPKYV